MPVPSSIDDLSTTPSSNSPAGSEPVGPLANDYLQALSAFIKQIATGVGWKPTAAVDMNGQKVTNIAQGVISSTSKDAVRGDQIYKVGEVRMWHGAVANIATTWGAGWQLADGTNGTADLRDRFIVGAGTGTGSSYAPNDKGGAASTTLTVAQLPAHAHVLNESGHNHNYDDPGHTHTYFDPGHKHTNHVGNVAGGSPSGGAAFSLQNPGGNDWDTENSITNLFIYKSYTDIGIRNSLTGITMQNTGSGAAIDNRPPYYALCFIEYVGP